MQLPTLTQKPFPHREGSLQPNESFDIKSTVMCKPKIMLLDSSSPSGKQQNKTLLIKVLARRRYRVQNYFDSIWNLYGMQHAIKHQHTQLWMLPSCLSAPFDDKLYRSFLTQPSLQEARGDSTMLSYQIEQWKGNFRKRRFKFTNVSCSQLFFSVCSQQRALGIDDACGSLPAQNIL